MERRTNPASWTPLGAARGTKIGLEIELTHPNSDIVEDFELGVELPNPEYVAALKYDGSVNGGEFVTQPATLAVHGANLRILMAHLRSDGFSADSSCGLHIHVARRRNGWQNRQTNANKLMAMVGMSNPVWDAFTRFVMGRGGRRYAAPITGLEGASFEDRLAACAHQDWNEKFRRVNFMHSGTIEFRQGHGTTHTGRILTRVEFALGITRFVEGEIPSTAEEQLAAFESWARERNSSYPHLVRAFRNFRRQEAEQQ